MHIANENWLAPLLALFGVWTLFALYCLGRDRRDLGILGRHHLVLSPGLAWARRAGRAGLVLGGFALLLLGAVRPQGKAIPEDLEMSGIDVMVVLDVSKSMLTPDLEPDRLGAAKRALLSWVQGREGDRVGLVVFAGESLVQVPLTLDLEALSVVLDRADVDAVDRGGTDIGGGIRTALASFAKEEDDKRGKAIILITDGELTEGASGIEGACEEAKKAKVPVVAVGIGTRQGRPIPDGVTFWGEPNYKKDPSGRMVVSHLDEKTLVRIAELTGGVYIHGDSREGLAGIEPALDGLQRTRMKGQGAVKREEWAPRVGAAASGFLFLAGLL